MCEPTMKINTLTKIDEDNYVINGKKFKRATTQTEFVVGQVVYLNSKSNPEISDNLELKTIKRVYEQYTGFVVIKLDSQTVYKHSCFIEDICVNRHIHADLMIQYANDPSLEIEFCSSGYGWIVTQDPGWLPNFKYRIKPKTKTVVKYKYYMHDPFSKEDKISGCYYIDDIEFKKYNPSYDIIQRLDKTAKEFTVRYE